MPNSSIWPIDRTLSDATTTGQNGSESDGNEGALCIPQSSSITRATPSDCLLSYTGHSLGVLPLCRNAVGVFYGSSQMGHSFEESNFSTEMQSVYSSLATGNRAF